MISVRLMRNMTLVLAVILLILPFALRLSDDQPLMPGSEGYGHARIAGLIAEEGIPAYDPAVPERDYSASVFDLLLAAFTMGIGIEAAVILLPLLLGLGTLGLLLVVLRKWNVPRAVSLGILVVFVISPFFADVFTQVVPTALELFLLMLFVLVLAPVQSSRSMLVIRVAGGMVLAGLIASMGVMPAIIAIVLPFLARSFNRKVPQPVLGASVVAFIVLISVALPAYLQSETPEFTKQMPVVQVISDFSGAGGLSLFAWILAIIGLIVLWRFKKKYYTGMILTTIALIGAMFLPSALSFGHLVVSFLAGYALAFLTTMRWSFDDIRFLTILVIVCGLLFSTLTHTMALVQGPPDRDLVEAAFVIKEQFPEDATILALPSDGFALAYWSGRQVFLDEWLDDIPGVNKRWHTAQSIWHSQEIMRVRPLLYDNSIDALVITKDMRQGKVWDLPEQDLLFLLRNSETFKNAYNSSSVDVWRVLPSENAQ